MIEFTAWDWFAIGMVFLFLEILISGVFLFWVGLGALTLALVMFIIPLGWQAQALIFAKTTLTYALLWSYFGKPRLQSTQDASKNLNARTMNYIGQVRPLEEAIEGGKGVVIIDDSRWAVYGPDLPQGQKVKVIEVQGNVLTVEPYVEQS